MDVNIFFSFEKILSLPPIKNGNFLRVDFHASLKPKKCRRGEGSLYPPSTLLSTIMWSIVYKKYVDVPCKQSKDSTQLCNWYIHYWQPRVVHKMGRAFLGMWEDVQFMDTCVQLLVQVENTSNNSLASFYIVHEQINYPP